MKKLLILTCALLIATSSFGFAAQGKVKSSYSGVVEKYDPSTKTLIVKKKDKQGEFVITDASAVELNKAKSDISAAAAGQKVDVEFVMDGATKVIVKAKVSGPAAATTTK